MQIEFLISTMNRNNLSFLDEMFKNININSVRILVVNQCTKIELPIYNLSNKSNIRVISVEQKGLSKSRNIALENTIGEIAIISDDDVVFNKDIIKIVLDSFNKKKCDFLTFKAEYFTGQPFKKYSNYSYNHTIRSIMKVSSIETAVSVSFIKKNNIKFDELFGIGASFKASEENIFLKDILSSGALGYFIPKFIVSHPYIQTGGVLDEQGILCRGAVFYRMFGFFGFFISILFVFKKLNLLRQNKVGILKSFFLIIKGILQYKKTCSHSVNLFIKN